MSLLFFFFAEIEPKSSYMVKSNNSHWNTSNNHSICFSSPWALTMFDVSRMQRSGVCVSRVSLDYCTISHSRCKKINKKCDQVINNPLRRSAPKCQRAHQKIIKTFPFGDQANQKKPLPCAFARVQAKSATDSWSSIYGKVLKWFTQVKMYENASSSSMKFNYTSPSHPYRYVGLLLVIRTAAKVTLQYNRNPN